MKARCKDLTNVELSNLCQKNKYPKLRSFACSVEAMFATTYVCEKLFSTMKIVKIKFRSRLTDKYLRDQLRLAVSDIIPDFETLSQRHSEDRCRFIFRAEKPWSIGWFYTRRFVCNCGRHLQWSGIRGRKTILGVPEATDPVSRKKSKNRRRIGRKI